MGSTLQSKVKENFIEHFKNFEYYSVLPGEREMCQAFGVSRPTLRKVLDQLEEDGIIIRIVGRGTFYAGNRIAVDYTSKEPKDIGLTSIFSREGKITKSKVLIQQKELPSEMVAHNLGISTKDKIFHLRRLRYVNDILYNIADDYLPLDIAKGIEKKNYATESLIANMKAKGVEIATEERVIEIRQANLEEANLLGINVGDPLTVALISAYDSNNRMTQYAISRVDAYKSRFKIKTNYKE